jgi:hypothetical protein
MSPDAAALMDGRQHGLRVAIAFIDEGRLFPRAPNYGALFAAWFTQ